MATPETWRVRDVLRARLPLSLLVVSAVLRAIYSAWAVLPYADAKSFDSFAHYLVTEGTFRTSFTDVPIKSIGYPIFLAAVYGVFGEHHAPLYFFQHAMDLGTCVLVLGIAQRYGLPRRTAVLAFAVSLFNPFVLTYASQVLTETISTFLVTLLVWILLGIDGQRRTMARFAAFGALISYAALCRPAFAPLAGILLVVFLCMRRVSFATWVRGSAVAAFAFLLVWAPWGARNYARYHHFVPYHSGTHTGNTGYTRWAFTWVTSMLDIYGAFFDDPAQPPARAYVSDAERAEVEALIAKRGTLTDPAPDDVRHEVDARFDELAWERIRTHRLDYYVVKPTKRVLLMWFSRETTVLAQANVQMPALGASLRTRPLAVLTKLSVFAWMPVLPMLILVGAVVMWREKQRAILLPLSAAIWILLVTQYITIAEPAFVVAPEPRYVIEVFPALTPVAAVGFFALLGLARRARELVSARLARTSA